jgi:hypothetical protein
VDGASRQGLSLGFLARDFGTTTFPSVPWLRAIGPDVFHRRRVPWDPPSVLAASGLGGQAASTRTAQAIANRDQRNLRQRGEYRLCKCPLSGKAGGLAGSTPARAYPHFCATRHDAGLLS